MRVGGFVHFPQMLQPRVPNRSEVCQFAVESLPMAPKSELVFGLEAVELKLVLPNHTCRGDLVLSVVKKARNRVVEDPVP